MRVTLRVTDLFGRKVATLDDSMDGPGEQAAAFDGSTLMSENISPSRQAS
jgi:hypothetical protein